MTSSLNVINHKSVSLTVAELWPVEIFLGQFDLDPISQGHQKSNHFFITTYTTNISGLQSDATYHF